MTKYLTFLSLLCFTHNVTIAQTASPAPMTTFEKVEKLNVLGTVLYIAAHPDDENTRLISYFANERKTRTAYLSLTRGDGGQNRIGTDIREKLGLIRTHELLGARSIDGGEQFFTRANDFGYSKTPKETLEIWNKSNVLNDVVRVIRKFKPDIIVNRFDHRTPGSTHGHHTSSAMLSVEAFDFAGMPSYTIPDNDIPTWSPARVFFNTSWWFYGSREKFEDADKSNLYAVDAGVYYPMRGVSNTEIAAWSRSMHKSQGFGSTGTRGSQMEYVEYIKGSRPDAKDDPLSGIDLTWGRVEGGAAVQGLVDDLIANYNFKDPSKNIPSLVAIYKAVENIEDEHWKEIKLAEIQDILIESAGLYTAAIAKSPSVTPGDQVEVTYEIINRSSNTIELQKIEIENAGDPIELNIPLPENEKKSLESTFVVAADQEISAPYWLKEKGTMGMYSVANPDIIGTPKNKASYEANFYITLEGLPLHINQPVIHGYNDPVDGEVKVPFHVMPQASVAFEDPVYIFPDRSAKEIHVHVKAFKNNLKGVLSLNHPSSWIVTPKVMDVALENKNEEAVYTFSIKGPYLSESAEISAQFLAEDGEVITDEVYEIEHDHISKLMMTSPASSKFERIGLERKGQNIAYVQGAGDDVPSSLEQIGYNVDILEVASITADKLKNYDALILGVRAYNTNKELNLKKSAMMEYMNGGGTVIVQYNTPRGGVRGDDIAPYPMEISRDRVTDENATMSFVNGEHEVLNYPNKISTRDFQNWVQERGLYFARTWDPQYQTPLACADPLESLTKGGLLIAKVGSGHYIYSGISWFRQLPAGVPGAFRLFTNLISIGKNGLPEPAATTTDNE